MRGLRRHRFGNLAQRLHKGFRWLAALQKQGAVDEGGWN